MTLRAAELKHWQAGLMNPQAANVLHLHSDRPHSIDEGNNVLAVREQQTVVLDLSKRKQTQPNELPISSPAVRALMVKVPVGRAVPVHPNLHKSHSELRALRKRNHFPPCSQNSISHNGCSTRASSAGSRPMGDAQFQPSAD